MPSASWGFAHVQLFAKDAHLLGMLAAATGEKA